MPRTKSAKKQMRQSRHRATQNRTQRSQLRTALKKVRAASSGADAASAYADATKLLDRAGRKKLIHPNAAARQKSRLARAARSKSLATARSSAESESGRRSPIGGPIRFHPR